MIAAGRRAGETMDDTTALVIPTERTLPGLRRSVFGMCRWAPRAMVVAVAAVALVVACYVGTPSRKPADWAPPIVASAADLGCILWMYMNMARKLFEKARVQGSPVFTITGSHVQYATQDVTAEVAWRSMHSVCVSSHTIYIFTTPACALFIDRGQHDARLLDIARRAGVRLRGA